MRSAFSVPIDIQSMHVTSGTQEQVFTAKAEQIGSCVWFVSPIPPKDFEPCTCQVPTRLGEARIRFFLVTNEQEDLIYQASKIFVLVADDKGKPFVPARYLTDNRGQYPCVAVEACFPTRLDGDILRAPNIPIIPKKSVNALNSLVLIQCLKSLPHFLRQIVPSKITD